MRHFKESPDVATTEPAITPPRPRTQLPVLPERSRWAQTWQPNWNAEHPDHKEMIAARIALGLVSGSTWISIKDEPNFQLAGLPVTPTAEMENGLPLSR